MTVISAIVFCCGASAALAAELPARLIYVQQADCSDPQTQSAMNICAFEAWKSADEDLNLAYRAAIQHARAMDTSRAGSLMTRRLGGAEDSVSTEEALRRAQRAWITFRDYACLAESDVAFGGSLQPLLQSSCFTDLTLQRTSQLLSFAEAF